MFAARAENLVVKLFFLFLRERKELFVDDDESAGSGLISELSQEYWCIHWCFYIQFWTLRGCSETLNRKSEDIEWLAQQLSAAWLQQNKKENSGAGNSLFFSLSFSLYSRIADSVIIGEKNSGMLWGSLLDPVVSWMAFDCKPPQKFTVCYPSFFSLLSRRGQKEA